MTGKPDLSWSERGRTTRPQSITPFTADLRRVVNEAVAVAVATDPVPVSPENYYVTAAHSSPTSLAVAGQWYDGPTLTLGEGTWLITAHVTIAGVDTGGGGSGGLSSAQVLARGLGA